MRLSASGHCGRPAADPEHQYRRLHESMIDAFASVRMDGRITESNRAFQQLTGYSAGELLELTYIDLTPAKWQEFEARILEEQILPHGHSEVYQKEYRHKDGHLIPVELRTFLIRDEQGEPEAMWAIVRDITDRLRLQEELEDSRKLLEQRVAEQTAHLRESRNRFRTLFNSIAPGCLVIDSDNLIIDGNESAADLLGCRLDELPGTPLDSFVDPLPDEKLSQHGNRARAGKPVQWITDVHPAKGPPFPASIRLSATRLGNGTRFLLSFEDISKRLRDEQELRESERRFRQLAEATSEAIILSHDTYILDCNRQLVNLVGWSIEELVGKPGLEIIPEPLRDFVASQVRAGIEGPYELELLHKDGTTIPVEARARMVRTKGKLLRLTAVRDLRPQRILQSGLERLRRDLNNAHAKARLAEVGAGIAHQLSQPLTAITNNVATLKMRLSHQRGSGAKCLDMVSDMVSDIEVDVTRARNIIQSLRMLANHGERPSRAINPNPLINDVLRLLTPAARSAGVRISAALDPGIPTIAADHVQLSQVFANVIQNAIDATSESAADNPEIRIRSSGNGAGNVIITISDNGRGIDPENLPRIFDLFFTTKTSGTGIGLALCRRIIHEHGGSISAESVADSPGTRFVIKLPTDQSNS